MIVPIYSHGKRRSSSVVERARGTAVSAVSRLPGFLSAVLLTLSAQAQSGYKTPPALEPEAHETPRSHSPLFFREEWKVTPGIPLLHPASQGDVGNPKLELHLYGPSGKDILMNGAPDLELNPKHMWTGMCQQTCALALRDKNNYVDLSGWGKIRWVTRQSGMNQVHAIIKLADGTWLVSEHGDAVGLDHNISEFTLSESRWIGLDIDRVVTRGLWLDKVDLTEVDEVGFTTLMPGSGHGYGGYADLVSIEVYGRPVPRNGSQASSSQVSGAISDPQLAPFAGKSIADLKSDPQAQAMGRKIFGDQCVSCHGANGRGKSGISNLTDSEWQWGATPDSVVTTITGGRVGLMPAWHDAMSKNNIEDVLSYTLTLSGRSISGANAEHGKQIYRDTCASCHGYDGKGNPAIGAPNLTDQVWMYGSSTEAIRESISKGRTGKMPPFADHLDATRIKVVAAYVIGFSESKTPAH
jgi:cbb3-type cytochrome c oxidase subunit III